MPRAKKEIKADVQRSEGDAKKNNGTEESQPTSFNRIQPQPFQDLLQHYPNQVPEKLQEKDEQRYVIIPDILRKRKEQGEAYLTLEEVTTLVDWKLSHGKFRPSLKKLISQNSEETVKTTTSSAFGTYDSSSLPKALARMTELRGIGPATASLLLSVYDPHSAPFFSDELFRWAVCDGAWDRGIKYNKAEYEALVERCEKFREEWAEPMSKPSVVEMEKVAWVLGRRGGGGDAVDGAKGKQKRPREVDEDAETKERKARR